MLGALLFVAVQATPAFAAVPTVTSVSPAFGTWQGGVAVTVTGTGFTQPAASNTVDFGTLPGTVTGVNTAGTSIMVTSPANPSTAAGTSVPVTVTNSNGTSSPTSTGPTATWTSGSTCLTGTFVAADVGQTVSGGTGLPTGAVITALGGTGNACASPNATINAATTAAQATAVAVTLNLSFTYPNCTFNAQAAGAVLTVVPGSSTVAISCNRLAGGASFVMALVSSVAGVVTPFSVAADEALLMNNSPSLPPSQSSDFNGNMSINLPVPAKQTGGNPGSTATDPDGTCPPTQFTVNQGLFTCAVAVANLSSVNFGNALLEYPGQLSPQTPTLSLSQTGSSTTTITATGHGWWGTGPDSSSIAAANIRIGCTGTPCTGGVTALSSNVTVSSSSYFINCTATLCNGNFQPTRLSGTFTIPSGATGTVAIDQPTREPAPCAAPQNCFPGNGPGRTDAATVTSGSDVVTDAAIKASDVGDTVTGTGIPANTFVGTVTAGASFLLSSSATSQVNVNATASGTSVVIGSSVEATAPGVATATATGTGLSTWNGNVPNNAISNSSDTASPNQFWQPAAGVDSTGSLTYDTTLPAATTVSAVSTNWYFGFAPPTGYTIQTSPDGVTYTTQVTVTGNASQTRNDVFPGGQVANVTHIRLSGITGFVSTACTGCGYAGVALVKLGWDGHGFAFPQAISPNTTPWRVTSPTPAQFGSPIINTLTVVGLNTGTTHYSYKVTAVNGNGESLASAFKAITNGQATLSTTNFNALFWTGIPGASSYNIYRGTNGNDEKLLTSVSASATTCSPDTAPVPPCFSDTGAVATGPANPPTDPGTVESTALNNPNNPAFFWQPTVAAAPGASYEVDLGSPTVLDSATPSWGAFFNPPAAYEIDTSNNGSTWTPQFTTTSNTSRNATDEFPGGQVTANYLRVVINAPFPVSCSGCGFAGVALNQLSWNGVAATSTATPPVSSLVPQGYYPTTLPNSTTANTTTTWNAQSPNNGLFGGNFGRVDAATVTSGSPTVLDTSILNSDTGHPVTGTGIPASTFVGTASPGTSFLLSSSATSQVNVNATAAGTSVTIDRRIVGGTATTCCSITSGSPTITAAAATFLATDVGRPIRGTGIGLGAKVTAFTSTTSITVSVNSTATASGVVTSLGGNSWWQPGGAAGNTGNLAVAFDLGTPRTVNSVTTSWLDSNFCPGGGVTCTGFEGINYQILTSPNGTQNSWTACATVTANAAFTTADTCTTPATGAQYVEYLITSWNAPTFTPPSVGYGPGFNSILIQ
jgi:hypothetical protein